MKKLKILFSNNYFIGSILLLLLVADCALVLSLKYLSHDVRIISCFIVFLAFTSILTTFAINKVNSETTAQETNDFGKCRYCANKETGRFLCSSCNSILWYNIKGNVTLQIMVFVLEQRWLVLTALAGLLLVTPVSIIWQEKIEENQKQIEKRKSDENRLNNVLTDLSSLRARLVNLELSKDYDNKTCSEITEIYTKIYWDVVPAFENLIKNKCEEKKEIKDALDSAKAIFSQRNDKNIEDFCNKSTLNAIAMLIVHSKFELRFEKEYIAYIDQVHKVNCSDSDSLKAKISERKTLSKILFHKSRVSSTLFEIFLNSEWLLLDKSNSYPYSYSNSNKGNKFQELFIDKKVKITKDSIYFNLAIRNLEAFKY